TVRQAPLMAMLSPIRTFSWKFGRGTRTSSVRPVPSSPTCSTMARHSTMPVNMHYRIAKKGSGTVAGTARRVLRTTVPDPFFATLRSRSNAAVQVFRRQVRRLVVHPEDAPLAADLAEVLGLEDQLLGADGGIWGILVEYATGIAEADQRQCS